jgi:hypothetical protein
VKPIPATPAILDIAPRIIWFESPQEALAQPIRFLAYAMTYARHEDMSEIRKHVSDADLREALEFAPPGIIDPRSWAYWNSKMGRYPAPPIPERKFGEAITLRRAKESAIGTEELTRKARMNWIDRVRMLSSDSLPSRSCHFRAEFRAGSVNFSQQFTVPQLGVETLLRSQVPGACVKLTSGLFGKSRSRDSFKRSNSRIPTEWICPVPMETCIWRSAAAFIIASAINWRARKCGLPLNGFSSGCPRCGWIHRNPALNTPRCSIRMRLPRSTSCSESSPERRSAALRCAAQGAGFARTLNGRDLQTGTSAQVHCQIRPAIGVGNEVTDLAAGHGVVHPWLQSLEHEPLRTAGSARP